MMLIGFGLENETFNFFYLLIIHKHNLKHVIMSNVMSLKKLKNNPSRNGFDLSRKLAFSAKISELLPVECIECLPGDKFKIRKQHFTRTLPVNTAAYTRIREYYDWFFVPTNLLWNKFNTFVTQMSDNGQSAAGIANNVSIGQQHPYFTRTQIGSYLNLLSSDSTPSSQKVNIFGYDRKHCTEKLLDYLGYNNVLQSTLGKPLNLTLNPFPLLAYQKIYQDFYRNSQWEQAYAPAWNLNYMTNAESMQIPVGEIDLSVENMFDLRYCNWNKDYFFGVLPNSQYGSPASIDVDSLSGSLRFSRFGSLPPVETSAVTTNSNGSLLAGGSSSWLGELSPNVSQNVKSSFTILALRQAEAAQKWAEITQSQQQDYKSQIEAHFGVNVSDAYSERCKFIDGHVNNLDISEVINQSLTGDATADIKGKGVGVGDGYISFDTQVHGYLMCVYHAVPILDYQSSGIRRRNTKTMVTDYAIPEFDKTGMIKVPFTELTALLPLDTWESLSDKYLGYAPQYYEYKTNYDEVKGAFVFGGLQSWVAPFKDQVVFDYLQVMYENNIDSPTYQFFKINPDVLNPIFVNQITTDNYDFANDQFLINCSFDIKAVRNLDYNGLPY